MTAAPPVNMGCPSSDRIRFLKAWLQNPLRVASVTPSSRSLAQLITSEISVDTGRVIELGPGTGVFTALLLERGVPQRDLTLIEQEPGFVAMLQARYPSARVLTIDAARLGRQVMVEDKYGATISGLPLLSMSPRKVMAILRSCFSVMETHAGFYQFTYGPRCPVPRRILDRLGLQAVRIGWTPNNIPPAAVYRISRRTILS